MALRIHPINFGNMQMDSSGLVMFRNRGEQVTIPVLGFLITGGEEPILVDTGSCNAQQYGISRRELEFAAPASWGR